MIEHFDLDSIDGVGSYDFRVGETVFVTTESGGPTARSIREEGELPLQPGHAYAIKSREKLNLPETIQVHLSLRFRLAAKKLFYSGGLVDPGFSNELYFVIFNLSSSEYPIEYEDPLVRGEFRRIDEVTEPIEYDGRTRFASDLVDKGADFESGPDMSDLLPQNPSRSREYRDWEMMNLDLEGVIDSVERAEREMDQLEHDHHDINERQIDAKTRLQSLEDEVSEIDDFVTRHDTAVETLRTDYEQIRTLLEYLLLAVVAAIVASITFAILTSVLPGLLGFS